MDIAERAKVRSRVRSQAKGKQVSTTYDDIIDLSSEDELSMLPKAKAKPKPKARAKKGDQTEGSSAKTKRKEKDPSKPSPAKRRKSNHSPESGFESDVNTIPVPTSDFPIPHDSTHRPSSQPSDLPLPPSSAASSQQRGSQDVGAKNTRGESPMSSPPPAMPRKRKRVDISELINLDDDLDLGGGEDNILPGHSKDTSELRKNPSVDTAPLPPAHSPIIIPETQPQAPPAKSKSAPRRKRKDADDEEEWAGDVPEKPAKSRRKSRADEEDEEDWDGDGASKTKSKAKRARKGAAKDKVAKEKPTKTKATPKGKAPLSHEVVDDSVGEGQLLGGSKEKGQTESVKAITAPSSSSTRESLKDASEPTGEVVSGSAGRKGKGKQRAVVLSDDEDTSVNAADVSNSAVWVEVPSAASVLQKKRGRKSSGADQRSKVRCTNMPSPAFTDTATGE